LPDHATWLWMLGVGGGAAALSLVSTVKPHLVRSAARRVVARDTLALRASELRHRGQAAGPIERVERASPVTSAALLGVFMAAGTWLYRSHLIDVPHRLDPAIHVIGPLVAVAGYLFMRAPTVGEKIDKQREDEEGAKFALNLLLLGLLFVTLAIGFLTGR
jgi:hypothetical protein